MNVITWVTRFVNKFGFGDQQMTREKIDFAINGLIAEEYGELLAAAKAEDAEEVIDALGDLSWLCIKLMVQLKVSPEKVFNQIGRANMSKIRGTKDSRPNSGGFDVVKPEGWMGPDHSDNHGDLDDIYAE